MFKFFLVIFVLNPVTGIYSVIDGWHPREQPDWKTCIERRNFARKQNGSENMKIICRKVIW